ncbi:SWIM-type domain-containing protein, partial [Aphis craccivora]
IDGTRRVKNTSCDCPAGAGEKCKHICALINFINNEQLISKTDLPQQWRKPSKAGELKYKKGRTIQDLFPCKRQKHFMDYISHKDLISMHNILSIPCSLSTLLKEESLTQTERQCKQILNSIIDQSSSEIRKTSRHFRISGSMRAHKIKTCRNWTDIGLNKLANSFLKTTDLGMKGNINVKYGNLNEPLAFENYQELYDDIKVLKAGLIIHHKTPWVCASPDGLVIKNGNIERILEIKCPISCKNKQIIENGVPNLKYEK